MSDDVEKLAKNQATLQKNFKTLKEQFETLNKRVKALESGTESSDAAAVDDAEDDNTATAESSSTKETSKPIENLGFKIFGTVGFLLILLGLFYLYRYAVDNGYLGITSRVALGTLFGIAVLVVGEVFRRKAYERFSQLLTGGGLAVLYFTFYATYAIPEYRAALGMTRTVNLIMLFIVMVAAVGLALRYDSMLLTAYAFLLGYAAPVLVNVVQSSDSIVGVMTATLILSIGMTVILWKKNWPLGIYPAVLSYLVYLIVFIDNDVIRYVAAGHAPTVAVVAFVFLCLFFALFNALALLLADDKHTIQNVLIAVLNGAAMLGFGLTIVWHYWGWLRGVFLILVAAAYLASTALAKARKQRMMFEAFFLLCITFITIAIPVQLEHSWIALAWAVEGFLLVRSGVDVETRGLRVVGYAALGLAFINVLFWGLQLPLAERVVGEIAVIAGLYGSAYLLRNEKEDAIRVMRIILGLAGSLFLVIVLAVEPMSADGIIGGLPQNARQVIVSVLWAALAVGFIAFGFTQRSAAVRISGIVLFAVTVLKILVVDLGDIGTLYRTLVTMVVGIIALGAAFAYIRNKDKIKAYLEKE